MRSQERVDLNACCGSNKSLVEADDGTTVDLRSGGSSKRLSVDSGK